MAGNLEDKIKEVAEGPQSAETDGVKVTQFSLRDLIEADKHLANKSVCANPLAGFKRAKIVPPGSA